MGQVTVFSGPERRRRWTHDERLQILGEAFSPGVCVAHVARRHDVCIHPVKAACRSSRTPRRKRSKSINHAGTRRSG